MFPCTRFFKKNLRYLHYITIFLQPSLTWKREVCLLILHSYSWFPYCSCFISNISFCVLVLKTTFIFINFIFCRKKCPILLQYRHKSLNVELFYTLFYLYLFSNSFLPNFKSFFSSQLLKTATGKDKSVRGDGEPRRKFARKWPETSDSAYCWCAKVQRLDPLHRYEE